VLHALAAMGGSLARLAALVEAQDPGALRDFLGQGATFRRGIDK
jgi:hypothetical protein